MWDVHFYFWVLGDGAFHDVDSLARGGAQSVDLVDWNAVGDEPAQLISTLARPVRPKSGVDRKARRGWRLFVSGFLVHLLWRASVWEFCRLFVAKFSVHFEYFGYFRHISYFKKTTPVAKVTVRLEKRLRRWDRKTSSYDNSFQTILRISNILCATETFVQFWLEQF